MISGTISARGYALYLRSLVPVYDVLETALRDRSGGGSPASVFARVELYRLERLQRDLHRLHGAGWRASLPVVQEALEYADRIRVVSSPDGARLGAHAYVRYFGDLSGGQILARRLSEDAGVDAGALGFLDFSALGDVARYRESLRSALDAAPLAAGLEASMLDEADTAFGLNIAVSEAVLRLAGDE